MVEHGDSIQGEGILEHVLLDELSRYCRSTTNPIHTVMPFTRRARRDVLAMKSIDELQEAPNNDCSISPFQGRPEHVLDAATARSFLSTPPTSSGLPPPLGIERRVLLRRARDPVVDLLNDVRRRHSAHVTIRHNSIVWGSAGRLRAGYGMSSCIR